MPTFPLVLTDRFRRQMSQDVAGETFLQLFEAAQECDHLLSVKLMETVEDPASMVAVTEAVEAAAQASTAAFIAANANDTTQIADAEAMRADAAIVFDHPSDLTWLVGQFYLDHTWADVVEQWLHEARDERSRPAGPQRPLLNVDPSVFRERSKAFITPLQQLLRRQRPSKGVLTFDQDGTLAVPVFQCTTTDELQRFLGKALAPDNGRRRVGGSALVSPRGTARRTPGAPSLNGRPGRGRSRRA